MQEANNLHEPLCLIYAKAKADITAAIQRVTTAYPLPAFMVEGILSGLLGEVRAETISELAAETEQYNGDVKKSYDEREKMLIDSFEGKECDGPDAGDQERSGGDKDA